MTRLPGSYRPPIVSETLQATVLVAVVGRDGMGGDFLAQLRQSHPLQSRGADTWARALAGRHNGPEPRRG